MNHYVLLFLLQIFYIIKSLWGPKAFLKQSRYALDKTCQMIWRIKKQTHHCTKQEQKAC